MILVTGANGFVGRALCKSLIASDCLVRAAVRVSTNQSPFIKEVLVGDISAKTEWTEALKDVKSIVHLAARVHVMAEPSADPLTAFRRVNVEATVNLAQQAAQAGVRRFVFVSSIKVNGESTQTGHSYNADDTPAPEDPYGVSKYEAEQALQKIAVQTGMEVVIVRPPLIYGPGVKANFESMMRWLARGLPLPLGSVHDNRRSLVSVDNLVDLIVTCLSHPAAANQIFLVSDDEDLSTASLLHRMSQALGKPARLIPVPVAMLKFGSILLRRPGIYQRLCGSLQIDMSKTKRLLGWTPPVSVDEGIRRAAKEWHQ